MNIYDSPESVVVPNVRGCYSCEAMQADGVRTRQKFRRVFAAVVNAKTGAARQETFVEILVVE